MLLNQLSDGIGDAMSATSTQGEIKTPKTAETTPQQSPLNKSETDTWDEDDPFGQDDSFLVQCSQAIDEDLTRQSAMSKSSSKSNPSSMSSSANSLDSNSNHTFKKPEMTIKKLSSSSLSRPASTVTSSNSTVTSQTSSNDVFDDDDSEEFEMLLSQIDIPKVPSPQNPNSFKTTTATTHSKQTLLAKQGLPSTTVTASSTSSRVLQQSAITGPPKPVLAQPQPSKPVMVQPQPSKPVSTQPQPSNSRVNTNLVRTIFIL